MGVARIAEEVEEFKWGSIFHVAIEEHDGAARVVDGSERYDDRTLVDEGAKVFAEKAEIGDIAGEAERSRALESELLQAGWPIDAGLVAGVGEDTGVLEIRLNGIVDRENGALLREVCAHRHHVVGVTAVHDDRGSNLLLVANVLGLLGRGFGLSKNGKKNCRQDGDDRDDDKQFDKCESGFFGQVSILLKQRHRPQSRDLCLIQQSSC